MRKHLKFLFGLLLMTITAALAVHGCFEAASGTGLAMAFTIGDMVGDTEPENMGGFGSTFYWAFRQDISVWPTPNSAPTTALEAVKLTGNYTMVDSKKFIQLYSTPRTAGGSAESQGELDAKSFLNKLELFYPSTKEEAIAMARKFNNASGVLIAIDPNTNKRIQLGSQNLPCVVSAKVDWGKAPADRRGVTLTFETDSFVPNWFYEGPIPLSGSTIPALS